MEQLFHLNEKNTEPQKKKKKKKAHDIRTGTIVVEKNLWTAGNKLDLT